MDENATDVNNAGQDTGGGTTVTPAADPGSGSQNGQQTDAGQAGKSEREIQLEAEVRRLNRSIASQRSTSTQQPVDGQGDTLDTPEGKYAVAIKLATSNLQSKLESVYSLYPEVSADDLQRIRRNPWAYVSNMDLFFRGDWEKAAEDIEYYLLELAETGKKATPQNPVVPAEKKQVPASVNQNTPAEPGTGEEPTEPDLYGMPLEDLAKLKNKELAKLKTAKK